MQTVFCLYQLFCLIITVISGHVPVLLCVFHVLRGSPGQCLIPANAWLSAAGTCAATACFQTSLMLSHSTQHMLNSVYNEKCASGF